MSNSVKLGIAAGAGFIAGYLVANWRNEKFYFDRANEEAQAAREDYESQIASMREALEGNARVDEEIEEKDLIAKASEALSSYQGKGGFEPVDVHAYAPKIQYSDYNTEEAEKQQPRETEDELAKKVPFITSDDFIQGADNYEQFTLQYYLGDDVLFDEMANEIIEEERRNHITGNRTDVMRRPGVWDNSGEWYLRNHELKHDYEIIAYAGSWSDTHESPGEDG